jgi:DNA topoisomerase-1
MTVGQTLGVADVTADEEGKTSGGVAAKSHSTQPPARYTAASLVKTLEELGVGRPSTYASIMSTIQNRGYCWKKGSALVPSFVAFSVVRLLEDHFATLVDYGFTAAMENDLDGIAAGSSQSVPWLTAFYFGNADGAAEAGGSSTPVGDFHNFGLKSQVSDARIAEIDPRETNTIPLGQDHNGEDIVIRVRWGGAVVQRGDEMAAVPEGTAPDEITVEKAEELFESSKERNLGPHPESGLPILVKSGRFGPSVQVGELDPDAKKTDPKPQTASLLKTMRPELVTFEEAMKLLSLPRLVGNDPETNDEIVALNGRYGPYLKKGTDSRSLESEEQLFEVTLEEALKIFAEPKRRRGQSAAGPLKELGVDPLTEKPIVIKEGRFGPYCTDGETNASVPRAESVEEMTLERASELLAERRAAGPKKKKTGAKKTAAKKTAKKTTAKKTTAKKTTAKKTTKKKATKKATATDE